MMPREATGAEVDLHDYHYRSGWQLARGHILLDGSKPRFPLWLARWRLRKALHHFEQALALNPTGWQSMWAMGKIHQRLGDHVEALNCFSRAHGLKPDQPDVAREAGLAALERNKAALATTFLEAAIRSNPSDAGLVANLALAQLVAGKVDEAHRSASNAVSRSPHDTVSRVVLRAVERVVSGSAPVPQSVADVHRLAR